MSDFFKEPDSDTDYRVAVAKVRERLAVSKLATQKVYIEKSNLKKLNEAEGKDQRQVKTLNRLVSLKQSCDAMDINRALETIREHIKASGRVCRLLENEAT
jgi:hypothetical protein